MRNFIVTIDGKQYEVGVEEVGATSAQTPVSAPAATPAPATPKKEVTAAPVNGTKFTAP